MKITGAGTTSLTTSATRATLNLQNSSGIAGVLDLGTSNTLSLGDGGILSSGTATNRVQGGTLKAVGNELVVTNRNALNIDSNIGETVSGTGFTKSGAGTLTLTGTNTYSGTTAIDQGSLVVSSDANLGTGSTIQFNGGTLVAAQSFSSSKNLTRGTNFVGVIDTGANNVTFSGTNSGGFQKTGSGTLTLSNPAAGTVFVTRGTMIPPNPTSGNATLQGGTLLAAGTLSTLQIQSASTLDIGGTSGSTLTTSSFSGTGSLTAGELTVRFGLGASASDLWKITNFTGFGASNEAFLFDFQDLGGVTTGTAYTLINATSVFPSFTAAEFAIALCNRGRLERDIQRGVEYRKSDLLEHAGARVSHAARRRCIALGSEAPPFRVAGELHPTEQIADRIFPEPGAVRGNSVSGGNRWTGRRGRYRGLQTTISDGGVYWMNPRPYGAAPIQ